jgi:hypothetical protein
VPRTPSSNTANSRKKALARLAEEISDPTKRRAFANDPVATMDGLGLNALPKKVRDFFASLTYEELRVLADLQGTMDRLEGLSEEVQTDKDQTATLAKL